MKKKANAGAALGLSGLGALIGAFSTLKATGDDPDKSKEGLLKLLIRNTSLGALTGAGAYGTIAGIQGMADAYKSNDLPGKNTANAALVAHCGSYKLSDNMKKAIRATLRTKKATDMSRWSPVTVGVGSAGLAALLTYLTSEKEKANVYNVAGNAGLAGLLATLGYGAYQLATPTSKKGSFQKYAKEEKKTDNGFFSLDNPAISWGLPSAATLGLLSYLTQDKKKKNMDKVLKHALTGGLLGTGAGLLHGVMYSEKKPTATNATTATKEVTLTPPSTADIDQANAIKDNDTWGNFAGAFPNRISQSLRAAGLDAQQNALNNVKNMPNRTRFIVSTHPEKNPSSPYYKSSLLPPDEYAKLPFAPGPGTLYNANKENIDRAYKLNNELEKEYNIRSYVQHINSLPEGPLRNDAILAMSNRLNSIPGSKLSQDQINELITKYSPNIGKPGFTPEDAQKDLRLVGNTIAALQAGKELTPEQLSLLDYYYPKK